MICTSRRQQGGISCILSEYYIPILCKQYNLIFNIERPKSITFAIIQYALLNIMSLAIAGMISMMTIIWTLFEHKIDSYIYVKR